MIRKFEYLFAFAVIALVGCQGNSFEKKIADQIEKSPSQEKCVVNIKRLTEFDWDKMYVFDFTISDEYISKTIKAKDFNLKTNEFTRKIIFTKENKVILCDSEDSDIENVTPNEVKFPIPDSLNYQEYTPDNAIFSASIRKSGDIKYYQLWQLSDSIVNNK